METWQIMKRQTKRPVIGVAVIVSLLILMSVHISRAEGTTVKIGVLAKRGIVRCIEKWTPTAEYLRKKIPGKIFVIVPLDSDGILSFVEYEKIDFVLANPSIYVELESRYGVNRIATLKNKRLGCVVTKYGGLIFCKADRKDIQTLNDLKGKTFMAAKGTSFGGWRAAFRELKKKGINPYSDFKGMQFIGTQDAVVYAVRDGKVDAGTVRTDTLERMAIDGGIDVNNFRLINDLSGQYKDFPFVLSTRLYPEWPFAKLKHTFNELSEKIAIALLEMPADSAAAIAARCAGWTIPLNYQPVHECLKELKLGPYKNLGKITHIDVFKKYWHLISITAFLFLVMTVSILFILNSNQKVRIAHLKMKSEISKRRKTEKSLETQRKQLISMFDGIDEVVYVADPNTYEMLYMNGPAKKHWGDGVGQKCHRVLQNIDSPCPFCTNDHIFGDNTGTSYIWEFQNTINQRWYRCIDKAIHWPDGRIVRFEMAIDFTERKRVEESLKESESKYRELVQSANSIIVYLDTQGRFTLFNNFAQEFFGYAEDEIIGKHIIGTIVPEKYSSGHDLVNLIQDIIRYPERHLYNENENIRKNGERVWVAWTNKTIYDAKGHPTGVLCIGTDITERKQAQEDLAQSNEQLEQAIVQANQMAVEAELANMAKSEFLANMSHEIRTPMNGVLGFADMLLDTNLDEDQTDYARTIKRSGESLLSLINDILDFSKIEAEKLDFEEIGFDPELLAYDVCELIRPKIESKPIEVLCRIGDNVPSMVKGDPTRYRQVLTNLMGNASKFTESGEIELSLDIEEEKDDRIQLHTKIRDTGIGIPKDKLSTIFEAFQQADGSTTRKYGGTGLGLSICKKISDVMSGEVWAESPPPNQMPGSVFHFTAWLGKDEEKENRIYTPVDLPNKKVLIVDDNQNNLEILTHFLESVEMCVVALTSGEEVVPALQKAHEDGNPFDICVSDIQMPDMDGYEVANQIRDFKSSIVNSQSSIRTIPLLALSSTMERNAKKCEDAGFDGFLNKPVYRQKLYKMLARLLGEKKGTKKSHQSQPTTHNSIATQYSVKEDIKHSLHILLAEDNPVNQKLAKIMLTKAGYHVEVANNGKEAVDKYTRSPDAFDLIFMDIQMPEMDGLEATKAIRKREEEIRSQGDKARGGESAGKKLETGNLSESSGDPVWNEGEAGKLNNSNEQQETSNGEPTTGNEQRATSIPQINHIPIIALTANAMKGDRETCLEAGMDDYMTKPIKRELVFEMIKKWVLDV